VDTLIANGQLAPGFTLPDLHDELHSLKDYRGKIVVVNFWSAECPYTQRSDLELATYRQVWGERVTVLPVASNSNEPLEMLERVAAERRIPLVLRDPRHRLADRYAAITTPHCFVIDPQGVLRYQGAFYDVTFRRRTPTRFYLKSAVDALLQGELPDPAQAPPYGCSIVRFLPAG
jgi:peroxiredoxin